MLQKTTEETTMAIFFLFDFSTEDALPSQKVVQNGIRSNSRNALATKASSQGALAN